MSTLHKPKARRKKPVCASGVPELYMPRQSLWSSSNGSSLLKGKSIQKEFKVLQDARLPRSHEASHCASTRSPESADADLAEPYQTVKVNLPTSSIQQYAIGLDEFLPPELEQMVFSYQIPAEDLHLRMTLPASDYKPNSKLALILGYYSANNRNIQMSSLTKRSLLKKDTLMLPVISAVKEIGVSFRDCCMLRSLPKGRLEQIDTLYIILKYQKDNRKALCEEKIVLLAIKKLRKYLDHVINFIVTRETVNNCQRQTDNNELHRFEFNLTKCLNKPSAIASAIVEFPYANKEENALQTYLDRILNDVSGRVLADAIVQVEENTLSLLDRYSTVETLRWRFFGFDSNLSSLDKQRLLKFEMLDITPLNLNEYPILSSLSLSGKIIIDQPITHASLISLRIEPTCWCDIMDLFKIHMPSLQYLLLEDVPCSLSGILPLYQYPNLVEMELRSINERVTIDMGDLPFSSLYTITLMQFHGTFQGTDRLSMHELFVDQTMKAVAFEQLHQKVIKTEVKCSHPFEFVGSCAELFCQVKNLKFVNNENYSKMPFLTISRSKTLLFKIPFHQLCPVFLIEDLEISNCRIEISPTAFPVLRKLTLSNCDVTFYYDSTNEGNARDFNELRYLAINNGYISPHVEISSALSSNDAGEFSACFCFNASNLKTLKVKNVRDAGYVSISSSSCPLLEIFHWYGFDYTIIHCISFSYDGCGMLNFRHLREISLERCDPSPIVNIDLVRRLPLEQLNMVELIGCSYITNFDSLTFQCQYANLSVSAIMGTLHKASRWKRKSDRGTLEMIKRKVSTVMPNAEFVVVDGIWIKPSDNVMHNNNEVDLENYRSGVVALEEMNGRQSEDEMRHLRDSMLQSCVMGNTHERRENICDKIRRTTRKSALNFFVGRVYNGVWCSGDLD